MRNIILVIIFSFLFINKNAIASDKWGEGELQLTRGVADYFIKYIKGTSAKRPLDFYVSLDGADAIYWFCPVAAQCSPGNHKTDIQQCYKVTGKKCKKFAVRRTIKWKNGINPAKGRASTINSKWSEEEILAKLTELGFYNNKKTTKKKTPLIKKKSNTNKKKPDTVVDQINELNKLYKDKVITKEEFEGAKAIILGL